MIMYLMYLVFIFFVLLYHITFGWFDKKDKHMSYKDWKERL